MKHVDQLWVAFEHPDPERNLRPVISELASEGCSKQAIQAMLEPFLVELRSQDCEEAKEDVLLDLIGHYRE